MTYEKKFELNCDYEFAMLLTEDGETLVGGSRKILKNAVKNRNFANKKIDVFFRSQPLGAFALDACAIDAERLTERVDALYANLCDKHTKGQRVAETLNELDRIFKADKNTAARFLAKIIVKKYAAATDLYMNARLGLGLNHADRAVLGEQFRAVLGEQFRAELYELISEVLNALKKKKPPKNSEVGDCIQFDCAGISGFFGEYSRFLASRKIFCLKCKLCGNFYLAKAQNSLYCADCKALRKQNSKEIYREKCKSGVFKERQIVKFRFENFIHKNRRWELLSESEKADYRALRDEFVRTSAQMLRKFEKSGDKRLEDEIERYLADVDSERAKREI